MEDQPPVSAASLILKRKRGKKLSFTHHSFSWRCVMIQLISNLPGDMETLHWLLHTDQSKNKICGHPYHQPLCIVLEVLLQM